MVTKCLVGVSSEIVICCYAFVGAERMRAFPPSTSGQSGRRTFGVAA
jgi:hypothetical protein